ncbi:leucine-rich repeat protein [Clostridium carboxidivorans P7]|uniref:Leucine-rich repeat protein n=1 Tax=Clostridium carboxidivorans P7 TaxID=536227 RepID=C6PML6_9CLOT|nr:leucine-rich repeat domain-containing protein [Clostridium carboxidivorans]EET89415.1 leucine-rich repeat protein [Clostridium carboxidivorans P7]
MKNKFIIGTLFSIFLLCSSNVKAVNFTDNQTVDANKTWTIKFNNEIQLDDLTRQDIFVIDERGNAVDVSLKLGQDGKSVIVTAPEYGYGGGKSYTLHVANKVHSINGKTLNDGCCLNFNVKRKPNSGGIVTFKDKSLEQEIRDEIEKPSGDIYQSDVDYITELYMANNKIKDFSGIENLTNLKQLNLRESEINDISELKNLVKLQSIDLSYNKISDISALKNLTNLKKLNLGNNKVRDISVLSKLTNLQELNLGYIPYHDFETPDPEANYNEISDISALKNLTNLQTLNLGYTKIKDLNALKGLNNLKTLDLSGNQISDISSIVNVLKELTSLNDLNLSTNEISNIDELNKLTSLKMLKLNSNKISNINRLKGLSNLQTLDLSSNQISDTANTLKELNNLNDLNLSNNQISNIGELNKLTNLKALNLYYNKISDISALKGLSNLQMIDLSYNEISDISVFENLANLRELILLSNPISDVDIQALKNALPQCHINEIPVKKPNIYLYPQKTEELSVQVTPKGRITKSIPEYNGGWKVTVDPSGKIDNTYNFLFYEALINYKFTLDKGWIVNKSSFNEEMNSILTSIGLNSKEKSDFIEYWSKELNWKSSRYAVYYLDPKEISEAIKLNLSKEPDSILRAYFYFVPLKDNENLEIKKPEIKQFKRNGFTVVEWGGIGK